MFGMKDLEGRFGNTQIEINGIVFNLTKVEEMSGILAMWIATDESYHVYATPDFEGIPISVQVFDTIWNEIGLKEYENEIYDFDEYLEIVTRLIKETLDENVAL